jgi:tetratricopeptide (TPR) repeat protein
MALIRRSAWILLLVACAYGWARADGQAEREARAHFESGRHYYETGQYGLAIAEFKAAYVHSPVPALLFNTAQAYRALHDARQARTYYRAYLNAAPDGSERSFAEARVQELDQTIGQTLGAPSPERASVETLARPEPLQHPGRGKRIAGLVTGAAGGAMIVAGIYFSVEASDKASELSDLALGPTRSRLERESRGDDHVASALYLGGGAAVVVGGILYYLGVREDSRQRVTIKPTAGGLHVAFSGAF